MNPEGSYIVELAGETLYLHCTGAMYWPATKTLFCADLHIGKAEHFRKNGVNLPGITNSNNYWKLSELFATYKPERIIFLGDMVHSRRNAEWDSFVDFMDNYPKIKRVLIKGNHEVDEDTLYSQGGFEVLETLMEGPFHLRHEPLLSDSSNGYVLCGHIHPAVRLSGKGRQSLKLSCFYSTDKQCVLPAFGEFTGTYVVRPKREDRIFVLADQKVIELKGNLK
jgi:uncharacterized protein